MVKGGNMNKDIDMGVYGSQRRDTFGYWILGTYNPRIMGFIEETKWIIWSTCDLQAGEIFFPSDI